MDNDENRHTVDLSENQMGYSEQEKTHLSEDRQTEPQDINPYDGMLERLKKIRNDHVEQTQQYTVETKNLAKRITGILQIAVIIELWIFAFQFLPFRELEIHIINILGFAIIIALTVVVVKQLGKWFENKDRMTIYTIIAFLAVTFVMQIMTFFIPLSFVYLIPVFVLIIILIVLLFSDDLGMSEKIVFLFVALSLIFSIVHYSRMLAVQEIIDKHVAQPTESATYKIFGIELD